VKVVGTDRQRTGSVVGPPLSVAITPDESLALVASSSKLDPADPTKLVPDDRITVIDLKDKKILDTIKAGAARPAFPSPRTQTCLCQQSHGARSPSCRSTARRSAW